MPDESTEAKGESRQRWIEDLQAALDRTGNAARTAWEATRENRVSALEAAKQAAKELGEVLEKGMDAARERWDTESGGRGAEEEAPEDASDQASPSEGFPRTDTSPDTASPEEPERP